MVEVHSMPRGLHQWDPLGWDFVALLFVGLGINVVVASWWAEETRKRAEALGV